MTRIARLLLIAALPLATHVALGAAPGRPIASAQEATASSVTLPPSDPGLLTIIRDCDGQCAPYSFYTLENTTYQIGEQVVSLASLRSQFSEHPDTFVLVVLTDDRKHVSLVRMSPPKVNAAAPAARAR
jgi:hypothetical protein